MLGVALLAMAGMVLLFIGVFFLILFGIIWISEWLGGVIPKEQYWILVLAVFSLTCLGSGIKVKRD